jgi:hypothetical protein
MLLTLKMLLDALDTQDACVTSAWTALQVSRHIVIVWRPDLQNYAVHLLSYSNSSIPVNASIGSLSLPGGSLKLVGSYLQRWQDAKDTDAATNNMVCSLLVPPSATRLWSSDLKAKQPVTVGLGHTNDMLSVGCDLLTGNSCEFASADLGAEDIHFTLDKSQLKDWISDVKSIVQKDLLASSATNSSSSSRPCLPPGYFWLRFGKPTQDFIGLNSAPYKQPVHVQLSLFKSVAAGAAPMRNQHVLTTIELLTLCK